MATNIYGSIPDPQGVLSLTGKTRKIYGLGYPVGGTSGAGYFTKQSGLTLMRNNITQFIMTEKGERVMLPSYGLNLRRFLFQPLDSFLAEDIRSEIVTGFSQFFPKFEIVKLQLFPSENINYEGGQGIKISLLLRYPDLNNTVFVVGAEII